MTATSDNAKAFRSAMADLARANSANARSIEQGLDDQAKSAEKAARECTEKNQRLVDRIRERADERKRAEDSAGQEIQVGAGLEDEDRDPEVERFAEQLHAARKAEAEPEPVDPAAAQGAERPEPAPAAPQQPADSGWNAQAGRFGKPQAGPPAEAPQQPAPPKPAPRRQSLTFDDDDDYENRTWLR